MANRDSYEIASLYYTMLLQRKQRCDIRHCSSRTNFILGNDEIGLIGPRRECCTSVEAFRKLDSANEGGVQITKSMPSGHVGLAVVVLQLAVLHLRLLLSTFGETYHPVLGAEWDGHAAWFP